jgi:hypothetical protein
MASADGSRWIFERTIYQVLQRDFQSTRIVHLFARVDQLDYVQEVLSTRYPFPININTNALAQRMIVKIQGAHTAALATTQTANENRLHARLSGLGCTHIGETRACYVRTRASPPHLGYIYMDWAPHRDLRALLRKYPATGKKQVLYVSTSM